MPVYKANYGDEYSVLVRASGKEKAKQYCVVNRLFCGDYSIQEATRSDILFAEVLGAEIHDASAIARSEIVIVLTGGPCAGKTTVLSMLTEHFSNRGYYVVRIREAATDWFEAGLRPGATDAEAIAFQQLIIRTQMFQVKQALAMARTQPKPILLICDRGSSEGKAFVPPHVWQATIDQNHWSVTQLRDELYGAVFHLVTAADGAGEYYTFENNKQRTETPEQAIDIDRAIQRAWQGHPHLRVIDNSTDFEGKKLRLLKEVCAYIGEPEPIENERKFLLRGRPLIPVPHSVVEITQDYLIPETFGTEERIRRRGEGEHCVYFHTIKKAAISAGKRPEIERIITPTEYLTLLGRKNQTMRTIKKSRACFLFKGKYFEVDYYHEPCHFPNAILEVEVGDDVEIEFPEWLDINREVTEEEGYSNFSIAADCFHNDLSK
jgi:CYTH domain-containing protein/predicted ATPase